MSCCKRHVFESKVLKCCVSIDPVDFLDLADDAGVNCLQHLVGQVHQVGRHGIVAVHGPYGNGIGE